MDKSVVKAIVERHLPFMLWDMQLQMWDVDVEVVPTGDDGNYGSCSMNETYEWARIKIDPEDHDSEEDVLRTIRHELIHVMIADMDALANSTNDLVNAPDREHFQSLVTRHTEKVVLAIERMMDHGYRLPLGKRPDYEVREVSPYETNGQVETHA